MDYLKVSIETAGPYAELLADALAQITGGCEVDDPGTAAEFASAPSPRWDYIDAQVFENADRPVTVNFYLADDADGHALLRAVGKELARLREEAPEGLYGTLKTTVSPMANQAWETSWRAFFRPFALGSRLFIRPSWEEPRAGHGRVELVIDPSSSFGTGTHATTKMCLAYLDGLELWGKTILDMGCGSGILSCGALLLGAASAVCCDIEPAAVTVTGENMALNGIAEGRYQTVLGDVLSDPAAAEAVGGRRPYDIIVANIVVDVLVKMMPLLRELLAENGVLILSGILERRKLEVADALAAAGLKLLSERADEGWVLYAAAP